MNDQDQLPMMLAASIHEVKNEFSKLLIEIEKLLAQNDIDNDQNHSSVAIIRNETQLIFHKFNRILGSYKSNKDAYKPNINEHLLEDFFEDILIHHALTTEVYDVDISWQCDDDLIGYFDAMMIQNVIDTAIYNSVELKEEVSEIVLTAENNETGETVITVEDDGPGYPKSILATAFEIKEAKSQTSTGLGLHFAQAIASAHQKEGKAGYIALSNNHRLKGACLSLHLP